MGDCLKEESHRKKKLPASPPQQGNKGKNKHAYTQTYHIIRVCMYTFIYLGCIFVIIITASEILWACCDSVSEIIPTPPNFHPYLIACLFAYDFVVVVKYVYNLIYL